MIRGETKKGRATFHVTALVSGQAESDPGPFDLGAYVLCRSAHHPLCFGTGPPLAWPCNPGWACKIWSQGRTVSQGTCLSVALPRPAPPRKGQAWGHMRGSRAVFHPVPRLFVQHAVQISLSQNMESGTALPGSMSKPFQVLEKVTPLQSSDLPDSITPQKCLDENCSKQSQRKASTSPLV